MKPEQRTLLVESVIKKILNKRKDVQDNYDRKIKRVQSSALKSQLRKEMNNVLHIIPSQFVTDQVSETTIRMVLND